MSLHRLEHKETRMGVYNQSWDVMSEWDFEGRRDRHPAPHKDDLLMQNIEQALSNSTQRNFFGNGWGFTGAGYDFLTNHYFGFTSVEQLRRWFLTDDVLLKLGDAGIVLSIYDSPTIVGHTQAIMHKDYHNDEHRVVQIELADFVAGQADL